MASAPSTSGCSGPGTTRSTLFSFAHAAAASYPAFPPYATLTFSTLPPIRAVPALPGATKTRLTRGDWASLNASACSRPPAPRSRTVRSVACGGNVVASDAMVWILSTTCSPKLLVVCDGNLGGEFWGTILNISDRLESATPGICRGYDRTGDPALPNDAWPLLAAAAAAPSIPRLVSV